MTDHSDFRARYLAPDAGERREAAAPEHGEDVAVSGPPAAPSNGHPVAGYQPHAAVAEGVPKFAPPPPAPAAAASTGWGTPPPPPQDPGWRAPAPIPPMPLLDHRAPAPAPPPWAPAVDPAQRWAPQADPHAASTPLRHIQVDAVVKTRREPATMGWRRTLHGATGGVVNLGAGPAERTLREWTARIKSNIPGNYQIAAVSVKGGVGKTRLTAALGSVFAEVRGEHVIAVDADTTYGSLGRLVDPAMTATVREFLADPEAVTHPRTRLYTGFNNQGLEVLGGHQNVASEFTVDQQTFFDTISRTRRIYQLCLVDSADIEGEVFKAVLSSSDALMIVGYCTAEGGLAVETTVNWLAARRGHELLKRSVIVLNDAHRSATPKFVSHVRETVGKRVRTVKTIPWDPHLRDAATLDVPALRKRTRLALLDLAAELATGFPTAGALTG